MKKKEKIRDAKKYDKFDYKVGSKSELLSFAVAFVLFLVSFIPVLADFPRDILRLICAVLSSYPFIIDAFYGIKEKKIKKSLLVIVIIMLAMFVGRFDQCAAAAVLFRVYDFLEKFALNKSRAGIERAASLISDTAHSVRPEGGFEIIEPKSIVPGMKLAVLRGETIPADGIVTEGESAVDYSNLTGEAVPVKVKPGDKILSGAVNGDSVIYYDALCAQADSVASAVAASVKSASEKKTAQYKKIKKFSVIFTLAGIVIALLVGIIGSAVTKQPFDWLHRGLTVLACVCPSVFLFGIVSVVNSAVGSGAHKGILFSGGDVFENVRNAAGIIFEGVSLFETDKAVTGDIYCTDGYHPDEIITVAAKCFSVSDTPEANAIRASAGEIDLSNVSDCKTIDNGVCAVLPEGRAVCGNKALMQSIGADLEDIPDYDIYVCLEGRIFGAVEISREIKKSAVSAVSVLRSNGVDKIYCYNDGKDSESERITAAVRIDAFVTGENEGKTLLASPGGKGKLIFVADDSGNRTLLSRAGVSVFCGDDAVKKSEKADISVIPKEPMRIVDALMLAGKSAGTMRLNIISAIVLKLIVAVLGILGVVPLFVAVIADIAALVICYINITRINKQR